MMERDPYKILGVSPSATDEEIKSAYRALARKYHPDNYSADNPLAELATEKMQDINEAYDTIQRMRSGAGASSGFSAGTRSSYSGSPVYAEIRRNINARRFGAAETALGRIPEHDRGAEWHYLTSVTLMHRGWVNDAMRELEMACTMDPTNEEYQRAKQMFNSTANGYGSTYYNENARRGGGCGEPDLCTSLCCASLLCDFCSGCG